MHNITKTCLNFITNARYLISSNKPNSLTKTKMANMVAKLVFIPAPGLGHIMSTIEIAKLFVNRDQRFSITVLVIKPPSSGSGSTITTYIESLAKNNTDRISFVELPQQEIAPPSDSKGPLASYNEFIKSHCKYVKNIVADMISQTGSGQVAGFVIDMFCTCMIDVANEFDVATYVFFTSNASFLGFKFFIQTFNDEQNQDVVELGHSDTEITVPTFVKPMPTKVFPTVFQTRETVDIVLSAVRRMRDVKAIIVNSFLEVETHAIESLSADNTIPPVYPVGPILNLEGGTGGGGKPLDDDVIKWLDNQPPSSVIFLCFGSMGNFDEVQVKEIARALEQSGVRFVWSLRKPPPDKTSHVTIEYEDFRVVLPEGFLERTVGIGKVIGWAPQVAVLGHRAVGGFVSHCGWNSLLESLWFSVPVATWPMYAEQQINAFEMVVELGLSVEIKLDYKRDSFIPMAESVVVPAEEIETGIGRLMEDDLVRAKVKKMSEKSRSTVLEGGSSYAYFGSLIQDLITNIS
ncbi:putative flavonol 3-O-glucosyltransferase [Helianthus annuus]|uniref:Glycosyltransferase n=1 Tax=Helianthus annuus TaxID=4232 RepID=A0A9K3JK71_HELAN|nr:anthocyanidin 3-O-glucosyltransferase 2-like [Helianthus annuus]KAF5816571.1 putative flavonol 3-O-glucosyltransferase [Helianthus annuus]KAJ0603118.1 putative flavonol 3-O-glucosyltransferase [Helianthus annuus]KAJ0945816.1 putative flavonol 3-O-glucosyltransferase [Helianthus annuus]